MTFLRVLYLYFFFFLIKNVSYIIVNLQQNVVTLRPFQSPLAICQWCVFVRIVWTFDDITATGHVKLTIRWAIDFVRIIATVVLFVTFERSVHTFTV